MAFENIVRPAQLPDNQPVRVNRSRRTSRNWMPVICKIAVTGTAQTASGSVTSSVTYYHKRRPTETTPGSTDMGFGSSIFPSGLQFP